MLFSVVSLHLLPHQTWNCCLPHFHPVSKLGKRFFSATSTSWQLLPSTSTSAELDITFEGKVFELKSLSSLMASMQVTSSAEYPSNYAYS